MPSLAPISVECAGCFALGLLVTAALLGPLVPRLFRVDGSDSSGGGASSIHAHALASSVPSVNPLAPANTSTASRTPTASLTMTSTASRTPPASPTSTLPVCTDVISGSWVARPGTVVVPLVPWGLFPPTNLSFDGFRYPGLENLAGEQFQPPSTLGWAWEPDYCTWAAPALNASSVAALLQGRWLHLDGDSLGRDIFFDIAEAVRQGNGAAAVAREKAHADLDVAISSAHLTLGWNPADRPVCEVETTWARQPLPRPAAPDIWIYCVSLWEIARGGEGKDTSVAEFRRRLECELDLKAPRSLGICRGSTPYSEWVGDCKHDDPHPSAACTISVARQRGYANPRLRNFTLAAKEAIAAWNSKASPNVTRWHVVDPWTMLFPRRNDPDFKRDGVHYTGVGSRTMTHAILQLVAACNNGACG